MLVLPSVIIKLELLPYQQFSVEVVNHKLFILSSDILVPCSYYIVIYTCHCIFCVQLTNEALDLSEVKFSQESLITVVWVDVIDTSFCSTLINRCFDAPIASDNARLTFIIISIELDLLPCQLLSVGVFNNKMFISVANRLYAHTCVYITLCMVLCPVISVHLTNEALGSSIVQVQL